MLSSKTQQCPWKCFCKSPSESTANSQPSVKPHNSKQQRLSTGQQSSSNSTAETQALPQQNPQMLPESLRSSSDPANLSRRAPAALQESSEQSSSSAPPRAPAELPEKRSSSLSLPHSNHRARRAPTETIESPTVSYTHLTLPTNREV